MFTNVSRPSAVDVLRPFTVGDTFYADTTSTLAKLPAGATNDVLTIAGGVPVWSSAVVVVSLSVVDSGFFVIGSSDPTKRLNFEVDAQSTGDTLTINTGAQTDSRTLTVPVLTGNATIATLSETQTFTGTKTFSTPIAPGSGGTGLSTYTTGDIPYSSSANVLSKLAIAAANTVLTSTGTIPQWSSTLTISGTLTANAIVTPNTINAGTMLGFGTTTFPALTSGIGTAYGSATLGVILAGYGSTYDVTIVNRSGSLLAGFPTGGGMTLIAGQLTLATTATPASAGATGTTGTISWDSNYIYVCVATNTWKRVAIATWP